jgi:hypothetical protein
MEHEAGKKALGALVASVPTPSQDLAGDGASSYIAADEPSACTADVSTDTRLPAAAGLVVPYTGVPMATADTPEATVDVAVKSPIAGASTHPLAGAPPAKRAGNKKGRVNKRRQGDVDPLEVEFALALLTNSTVKGIAELLQAARVDLPVIDVGEAQRLLASQVRPPLLSCTMQDDSCDDTQSERKNHHLVAFIPRCSSASLSFIQVNACLRWHPRGGRGQCNCMRLKARKNSAQLHHTPLATCGGSAVEVSHGIGVMQTQDQQVGDFADINGEPPSAEALQRAQELSSKLATIAEAEAMDAAASIASAAASPLPPMPHVDKDIVELRAEQYRQVAHGLNLQLTTKWSPAVYTEDSRRRALALSQQNALPLLAATAADVQGKRVTIVGASGVAPCVVTALGELPCSPVRLVAWSQLAL